MLRAERTADFSQTGLVVAETSAVVQQVFSRCLFCFYSEPPVIAERSITIIVSVREHRAVVSALWACLSSRHGSALYCFYCIVSVLTNKIFSHSFISPELHVQSSADFCSCYTWPRRRRGDTLRTTPREETFYCRIEKTRLAYSRAQTISIYRISPSASLATAWAARVMRSVVSVRSVVFTHFWTFDVGLLHASRRLKVSNIT